MKLYHLEIHGQSTSVWAERCRGTLWFHWNGKIFSVPLEDSSLISRRSRRSSQGSNLRNGQVLAPMPGKITQVLVKKGDSVTAGAPLIIMEAMKMEYTLAAEQAGIVQSLSCQIGDQVALGQNLIQVKESEVNTHEN